MKCSKGGEEAKSSCRRLNFGGRTLAHFIEILEEEIERSKFSMENTRSHKDCRIQSSCKVEKGWMNHYVGVKDQLISSIMVSLGCHIILRIRGS